jgi:hypothetical protein
MAMISTGGRLRASSAPRRASSRRLSAISPLQSRFKFPFYIIASLLCRIESPFVKHGFQRKPMIASAIARRYSSAVMKLLTVAAFTGINKVWPVFASRKLHELSGPGPSAI